MFKTEGLSVDSSGDVTTPLSLVVELIHGSGAVSLLS